MPDSVGNTLNTAQSIIIGTTTQRFSDSVEFGDNDYFRFTLNSASSFNLVLSGLSANADVEVLNSTGALVTANTVPLRSDNEGTLVESINTILDPGTYYIRVQPGPPINPSDPAGTTPSTNYNLDVRADNGIRTDILWRYNGLNNGANGIWRMNGTEFASAETIGPQILDTRWQIQGTGDFNRDGQTDIVWRFFGDGGTTGVWLMDGTTVVDFLQFNPVPDLQWSIAGVADFNADGNQDLLWRRTTGENGIWLLDSGGAVVSVAALPSLGGAWDLQAVGDFNGDLKPDLFWRLNGGNAIWYLDGVNLTSGEFIVPNQNLNAQVQGAGDFNGDGNTDLFWRDFASGANEIWLMRGAALLSIVPVLGVADPNWSATVPFVRNEPVRLLDSAGNNTAPLDIGPLNGNGLYQDAIGLTPTDINDYYRFTLGSPTRLSLQLDGLGTNALQGDLDVQIVNSLGNLVAQSRNPGTSPESISNLDLTPGTYFIRVFQGDGGAASSYDLDLTVNNLPVLVSSGPLTVSEGNTQTISNSLLLVNDENDPPPNVTYTLVTPPNVANGSLSLNGALLAPNSIFTQADINQGRLVYQHNGSESVQDTFVFAVADGRGGTIPNTTFTINVIPVNDPPTLQSLTTVTVTEAGLATISNTTLSVTDTEQAANQIFYSLNSLPTNGTLSLATGPLTLGSTFTQADINANRLTYRQNGSETTTDTFTFTATDGAGGFLNPQIQTFSIQIQAADDAPVLVTNTALTVSQAGPSTISSTALRATDAEFTSPAQQDLIKFSVTQLPTEGTLFLNGTEQLALFTFSQADLNANRISYAQSGTPTNSDRFNFTLSDGTNTTTEFTYEIFVQGVAGPPVLATNARLTVSEGQIDAPISNTLLRVTDPDSGAAFLTYTVGAIPTGGSLKKSGTDLTAGQTFTQADINNGRITYAHNGSEAPLTDFFTFTFQDESGAGPATTQTFSINITPVNDLPTILSLSSQVTVTESFALDITSSVLNVTDPDNLPQDITYTVTTPSAGTITRFGTATNTFTQADVNSGQVKYQHSGSESTADSFTFEVTDLSGTLVGPGTVNISVIPFNDAPGLASLVGITLDEGATQQLADGNLFITDDDGPGPLTYTIGAVPTNGIIRRGNVTLSAGGTFTQADVTNGQIFYVHSGSETTSDRFTFTASDGATTGLGAPGLIGERTFSITVNSINDAPAVSLNQGITVAEEGTAQIPSSILRTTDADNLTSQLTYNLSAGPSSGTLLRAGTATNTFTQADLDGNLISYKHSGSETTLDAFIFDVTDGTASTGAQTFNITVTPVNDAPRLLSNNVLTVDEASTANAIPDSLLLATDPDGPSPTIIYTLSGAPTRGSLVREGVTLSNGQTFTQAQISSGLLSYSHNGSETTSDRFTFTASDGGTGVLTLQTFSIVVNSLNDDPIITVPTAPSLTVNEDQTFTFASTNKISVGDPDGGPTFNAVITTSSGGTINLGTTSGLTNLVGNGSSNVSFESTLSALNGALNNLRYRGLQDFNGPETIIVSVNDSQGGTDSRTITMDVTAVNDAPTLTVPTGTLTVNEDTPTAPIIINVDDVDADASPIRVALTASNGGVTVNDNGALTFVDSTTNGNSVVIFTGLLADVQNALNGVTYQGRQDAFGSDRIIVTVDDQGATGTPGPRSVSQTLSLNVVSVNDKPTFVGGLPQFVIEDSGQQVIPGWATGISRGAANESTQGVSFTITSSDPTLLGNLFTATPTINPTTGNLTFTPRADANGTIQLTAILTDNGGVTNGGVNTSDPYIFEIAVAQRNDAPVFVKPLNAITINEDPTPTPVTLTNWATGIRPGPTTAAANESTQTVNFLFETNNPSLFTSPPEVNVVGTNGNLVFTPAPDANGTAIITVRLQDDGGTANGGTDTSAPQLFTIVVRSVNDAPTFNSTVTTLDVLEDSGPQSLPFASEISVGPSNESSQTATFALSNSNPSLFLTAPAIDPATGQLTFTPAANASGSAIITATLRDNGGTANGGQNSSVPYVFTVNVTAVNDAPSFVKGLDQVIDEDAPAQTVNSWATNISAGPNEATQTLTFDVTNSNPTLFSVAPTVSPTGVLTYTAAPNASGTAIVTLALLDNGGTANGGIDTSAPQTFTITVNAVNDAPTLTVPSGPLTTAEDTPINFSGATAIQLTDIDAGTNPIRITLSVTNGTVRLPSTTGLSVTSGANGSNTVTFTGTVTDLIAALASVVYTPNANYSGSDSLAITVNDQGGTGKGGAKSVAANIGINVTAQNDPPVLATVGNLAVPEAGNRTISNTLLRTTDVDNTAAQITYTLSSTPTAGFLRLSSGSAFTTLTAGSTFTQSQIDAGRLNYLQNGSETTTDSFSFSVSDGQIVLTPDSTFSIGVIPVNDPPLQVVNANLNVTEGDIGSIDNTFLQFTDGDNTPDQLVYTVTSAPTSGILRLGGSDLTSGATFTQEQVDFGLLTYEHSGSETTADSFNFALSDGTNSVTGAFNITVASVNDQATVVTSGPLTVSEGSLAPVSNLILRTTDPDTPTNQIVYTLRAVPLFGSLLRGSTTLATGGTFTQADIDSGAINYRHNGSENATDVFTFDVSDGGVVTTDIFNISVRPVNDPPALQTNRGLTLSQSSPTTRVISNSLLRATDVDAVDPATRQFDPKQVFFKLASVPNPTVGSIRLNGSALSTGQRFSQDDVNNGRVSYQYLGGGTSDGFQFSLEDANGGQAAGGFFSITFTA